jgi:hypothetical protein
MPQEYKYKCRECVPDVRHECIEQAHISPGVKRIIERAFDSHTDTKATWDLLQRNCLLVKRDEMVLGLSEAKQSGLLGRLQKRTKEPPAEESKESIPVVSPPTPVQAGWQPNWDAELRAAEAERAASEQESPTFVPLPTSFPVSFRLRNQIGHRVWAYKSPLPESFPAQKNHRRHLCLNTCE